MKHLDLFSGIGGFALGLERAGFETVAFCEIEEYPRKILKKHWPDVPIYEDVRGVSRERLESDGITDIGIITGGFPCQDISVAGKQAGIKAERSGLWSELCRIIGDIRPRYAIVENVTALLSGDSGRWFGRVLGDLAEVGYDCEWHCIPASELGANHHRDRVWVIAYPQSEGLEGHRKRGEAGEIERQGRDIAEDGGKDDDADTCSERGRQQLRKQLEGQKQYGIGDGGETMADPISIGQQGPGKHVKPLLAAAIKNWQAINAESGCISGVWAIEPDVGRVANGIPKRMDRLKGLGNAVVPQIPELIGRAIMECEA